MKTTMEDYAAFEQAMNDEKLYRELDYVGICRRIGADRDLLEDMLVKELGFEGQDLVDYYLANFG